MSAAGTTPEGARSEQEAARWVRSMFGRVARRYDLANHLLTANIDRYWRNRAVARVRDILERPERACARSGVRHRRSADRSGTRGRAQTDRRRFLPSHADGAQTSCGVRAWRRRWSNRMRCRCRSRDASLDLITIAFGYRNLANYRRWTD